MIAIDIAKKIRSLHLLADPFINLPRCGCGQMCDLTMKSLNIDIFFCCFSINALLTINKHLEEDLNATTLGNLSLLPFSSRIKHHHWTPGLPILHEGLKIAST